MSKENTRGFSTIAIHEGQEPDPRTGDVIAPIHRTTTFAQKTPGVLTGEYDYSRSGNPNSTVLEKVLAGLEGGEHGLVFASGTGALTTLALTVLKPGDHVIVGDDVYGGTFRLFDKVLKSFDIEASYVDMTDPDNVRQAITSETKMIFLETPTNPLLKLIDLQAVINIAKEHDLVSCVDNTFASPYLQRPLDFGADIVLHSTTKYINGHSDVVGGALVLRDGTYIEALRHHQNAVGATADPQATWLTLRGVKTLALRMEAHVKNGQALAEFLEEHDMVEDVIYPGLKSHPQYDLAQKQMKAPGGMMSIRIKGGAAEAEEFLRHLRYFTLAESLGGIESLIEIPAVMTHATLTSEARQALGITDNLVRISVGIEDLEDLKADLAQALQKITSAPGNEPGPGLE